MLIIGIAGGSGSGKTTVVKHLIEHLPANSVSVLYQDSYYFDNSHLNDDEKKNKNFDHPDAIDFEMLCEHVQLLKQGCTVEQPVYSFITSSRKDEVTLVHPSTIIIVEGILLFTCLALLPLLTLKVFVDADDDDRLARIIVRDIRKRGRTLDEVLSRYYNTVKPMHQQFIEPSKRYADIIIPGGGFNQNAIEVLTELALRKIDTHE